ncbi:hypothetical protein HMPREF9554_02679 [Treponema phagedenis F0421]|nr:hypothetical protein HMPREF9554_02679 [Treponema phagedenis F0421]
MEKKMKMKKFLAIIILSIITIATFSCKNPPIFAAIEQEIKLKPASMRGIVRSIAACGSTLYTSDGELYTKKLGEKGKWEKTSEFKKITGLASNGNTVYVAIVDKGVFTVAGIPIQGSEKIQTVFGDNKSAAYGVEKKGSNSKVYKISGNTLDSTGMEIEGAIKAATKDYLISTKGAYKAGSALTGTPVKLQDGVQVNADLFVLTLEKLYAYNSGTQKWASVEHTVPGAACMTYWEDKNILLIGGASGYGEVQLDSSDLTDLTKSKVYKSAGMFDGSSTPKEHVLQYNNMLGKWTITNIAIFPISDPNRYVVYAGVGDPSTRYSGLWGFYNPEQLEWNRE